jgi:hypothetical protein
MTEARKRPPVVPVRMKVVIAELLTQHTYDLAADLPFSSVPQLIGGFSQADCGLPQIPREHRDGRSEEGAEGAVVLIKKFGDMPYRDQSDVVAGALFFLGLGVLFAYAGLCGRSR